MTTEEKNLIELEREELQKLIRQGFKFHVEYKHRVRVPGLRGYFQRKRVVVRKETFEIQEPTLSTLDRLSEVWLGLIIDEEQLQGAGGQTLAAAKQIVAENTDNMARIVAIAVLGEDYFAKEVTNSGRIHLFEDKKELKRLTLLFKHTIKPSKLTQLAGLITSVSNLADFIGSMRLLSGARTTLPREKESIE